MESTPQTSAASFHTFNEKTKIFLEIVKKEEEAPIDIFEPIFSLTLETIFQSLMGIDKKIQTEGDNQYKVHMNKNEEKSDKPQIFIDHLLEKKDELSESEIKDEINTIILLVSIFFTIMIFNCKAHKYCKVATPLHQ